MSQSVILDHYRNPRNRGEMTPPCAQGSAHNTFCGDTVTLWVRTDGDDLVAVSFDGKGCTISQAAASIVTERASGSSVEDLAALRQAFTDALTRDTPELPSTLGDLRALVGVRKFPNRIRCAMLAFAAFDKAVARGPDHLTGTNRKL
ncbi:MAG: Fe-S cluster assembly sulfur transfer protein SufU [Longimicrobiales bacterium]